MYKISRSSALRAEGRSTAADVSSIGLAKEECRGYNARRAVQLALVVAAPLCWGRISLNRGFAADNESRQCRDEYVETRNTCRDFIGDELLAEPEKIDADHPGGFPCFDLFFASHRSRRVAKVHF